MNAPMRLLLLKSEDKKIGIIQFLMTVSNDCYYRCQISVGWTIYTEIAPKQWLKSKNSFIDFIQPPDLICSKFVIGFYASATWLLATFGYN